MLHHHRALCFECTGCGRCCHGGSDDYVALRPGEAEAIADHLQLDLDTLTERYLVQLTEQLQGVRLEVNGPCVFLDDQQRCGIYPVRPLQCRTYPYWRELLASETAWTKEAERCEGIGRGAPVDVDHIEQMLALDADSPLLW